MSELQLDWIDSSQEDGELRASVSRLMRGLNHDLKNPLGAADGYLDLMLQGFRGDLTDEQRQTLERVRVLIASGVEILEDVVTFTRASLGELRVNLSDADINVITRMALEPHASRAREGHVTLELAASEAPVRTSTDPDLVGRILRPILANALDYTPDGGRVDVRVERGTDNVAVTVRDTGPGVPPEDAERVFLEFERGPAPLRARETSGIGFGLPLARALAASLDGSLELVSEPGSGTTVTLRLPLRA